ncbi:MAG: dihydroorotase, partial [Acidilobaceae archaeon]
LELSYKEDEASGTLAALRGCLTGVVDMPNTKPPLSTPEALEAKLRALSENSYVDYSVYAGVPSRPELVRKLAEKPIVGFKIYPEDFEKESSLCEVLREAERRGLLVVLHAEHPLLIRAPDYGYDRRLYRSCVAEELAVLEIAELTERCRAKPRIHVTHVSCYRTLELAKSLGFTVDVTPHHLLFSQEEAPYLFSPYCESKVNPPLRDAHEKSKLWIGVFSGLVDALASDHAPHAFSEKTSLDPSLCSPGFSSIEAWPGVMARVFYGIGAIELFARLASENPAKILGLGGCFGFEKGCVASLSVFRESITRDPMAYTKARVSPYSSLERLECLAVIVRGRLAMLKGRLEASRGSGFNLALSRP